jgi:hypothetical protein
MCAFSVDVGVSTGENALTGAPLAGPEALRGSGLGELSSIKTGFWTCSGTPFGLVESIAE